MACLLVPALAALLLISACARQSTPSAVETMEVKAAVDSLWVGYAHASDRKDAAAFGTLFTEDATLVYSGESTVHGREAIQSFLAALYAPVDPTGLRIEPEETRVSGSIAVQSGAFQESFTRNGVPKVEYGRFVLIAEQGADGSWKIRRLAAMEDSTR